MFSKIFYFHPENWGNNPIWLIFFKRVVQPPPSITPQHLAIFQVEKVHLQTTLVAWMNIANWLRSTLASTETGLKKTTNPSHGETIPDPIFIDSLGFGAVPPPGGTPLVACFFWQRHRNVTWQALDELRGVAKPVTGRGQGELRWNTHQWSLSLILRFWWWKKCNHLVHFLQRIHVVRYLTGIDILI